jgi:hypothetical protein
MAIEVFLRDVAHVAHENGIDHRSPHINAAFYPCDSSFYAYRNRVQEVISRHGSWTGMRIRKFEQLNATQRRRGVPALVPFRRRKRQTSGLSVAMFAIQRLLALWKAFDALPTSRPPTEAEQAVYRIERGGWCSWVFRAATTMPTYLTAWTR